QCPQLTQVYILAKLLAALIIDQLVRKVQACYPEWFSNVQRPISLWRLTILLYESIADSIRGTITLPMILTALPNLQRFLCNSPRQRPQQFVQARNLLAKFTPQIPCLS
ncbi:MAG: hypothetical protein QMD04_11945, partial [Anaerolineales bacterium]|nr:hypothetical protein [Anaerolineales bacterium]